MSVFRVFWSQCGKIRIRKTPNMDIFARSVVNKESESVSQVGTSQTAFTCCILFWRDQDTGTSSEKIKVKQAGKIIKFSETYVRNYWGKPKNRTLKALIQKKSRIIEPSGKLLFLFSQIRRQEVKILSLLKQKNIFLMIKKYPKFLITSFQTWRVTRGGRWGEVSPALF